MSGLSFEKRMGGFGGLVGGDGYPATPPGPLLLGSSPCSRASEVVVRLHAVYMMMRGAGGTSHFAEEVRCRSCWGGWLLSHDRRGSPTLGEADVHMGRRSRSMDCTTVPFCLRASGFQLGF